MTKQEKNEFYKALESSAYHLAFAELRAEVADDEEYYEEHFPRVRACRARDYSLCKLARACGLSDIVDAASRAGIERAERLWEVSKRNPKNKEARHED